MALHLLFLVPASLLSAATGVEPAAPRRLVVNHWRVEEGLPQNTINAIVQTRDGYIWVASFDGVARFDGVRFLPLPPGSLDNNRVLRIVADSLGSLWVLTETGTVSRYSSGQVTPGSRSPLSPVSRLAATTDGAIWMWCAGGDLKRSLNGTLRTIPVPGGLGSASVNVIFADREGNSWLGTAKGLARLNASTATTYTTADGLPGNYITAICDDQQSNVWVGTTDGIARWAHGTWKAFTTRDGLPGNSVATMACDNVGTLWVVTADGRLARTQGSGFVEFPLAPRRATAASGGGGMQRPAQHRFVVKHARAICRGLDGTLWVVTDAGIVRIRDGTATTFPIPYEFEEAGPERVSTCGDREGNLWIGTQGDGLFRLKPARLSVLAASSLPDKPIYSIAAARDGSMWIGTDGGGVARLQGSTVTTYTTSDGLPGDYVWSVYEDHNGDIWAGTWRGLARLSGRRFVPSTDSKGQTFGAVVALSEDRGGTLWIGTYGEGLKALKDGRIVTLTARDGLASDYVRAMHEDRNGALWIATDGGVTRLQGGKLLCYNTRDGLPDNLVRAIYEDRSGALWFGTYGNGLARFKNGKFAAITPREGLFDHVVSVILEDDNGNFWMNGNKGIYRAARSDLDAVADGKLTSVSCVAYGRNDGMKNAEGNGGCQPAGCRTPGGQLWFPTAGGAVMVDPVRLEPNRLPPPVVIEDASVDGRAMDLHAAPRLTPGPRRIQLSYTALSFANPANVMFKFRLDGFDRDWIYGGPRREVTYTNLPAGRYRFHVIACNNDGVWNNEGASWAFEVAPFFYRTPLFYGLCFLAAGGVLLGLHHEIVQRIRARNAVLAERNRIAQEIHDTMGQTLTGLLLQLAGAHATLPQGAEAAQTGINRARELARECMEETRRAVAALRPRSLEAGSLVEAMRDMARSVAVGAGMDVTVDATGDPRPLPEELEHDLWHVCQEAVTNAVRHSRGRRIQITIGYGSGFVRLCVADDGVGMDATPTEGSSGAFGLVGIRQRAHGRRWKVRVQSVPGQGTKICAEARFGFLWWLPWRGRLSPTGQRDGATS